MHTLFTRGTKLTSVQGALIRRNRQRLFPPPYLSASSLPPTLVRELPISGCLVLLNPRIFNHFNPPRRFEADKLCEFSSAGW